MANKSYGKSRKIKALDRYTGEVGVYDLSRKLKKGKISADFLLISKPKPVSGKPITTIWASDEFGTPIGQPLYNFKGMEVKEILLELGYKLV